MESEFPSLQDHCLYHIITHIKDYSPDIEVALLPRHLRLLLLQNVAPVHLVWLERTAVASGIDTDSVWGRFLQYRDDGLQKLWLNQPDFPSSLQQAHPRDLYVSYIYKRLFATRLLLRCLSLALFLYGLSEPIVEEGILRLAQNSPTSLIGRVKSHLCCVPNFTPQLNTFESICCTLLTYNIFPRVLYLSLSSCNNLVGISSTSQRPSQLEQFFACSAVTEYLLVSLNDRLPEDVATTTRILSGLRRCRESQLSTLRLEKVAENTLSSIAPVLASKNVHLTIKTLEFVLFHGSEQFIPPLVEILNHQTSLESLSLTFQKTTCGQFGRRLLSSLSRLFAYPNFKEMELKYLIDFPIAGIVSAFLCSMAVHQQSLELVQQRVAVPRNHLDLDFELPESKLAHLYGAKRDLICTSVTASRPFYDWLLSMPSICLNTMTFSNCGVIADGGSNFDVAEKLEAHPDASVTHFSCTNFHVVQW